MLITKALFPLGKTCYWFLQEENFSEFLEACQTQIYEVCYLLIMPATMKRLKGPCDRM